MDKVVKISHPNEILIEKIVANGKYELLEGCLSSYTEENNKNILSTIVFNLKEESFFNCISFDPIEKELDFRPEIFRFEISNDGISWEPIIQEIDYSKSNKKKYKWNFSLIVSKYLKLVVKLNSKNKEGIYKVALCNFKIKISGIERIQVSSENDRFWVKENIIDTRVDYGWSSKEMNISGEEFLLVDLGSINRVEELKMLTKNHEITNFPEHFYVYYSEDDLSWYQLFEEPRFMSESATWYKWRFYPTNIRFLKLVSMNNRPNPFKKYVTQIVELELYATADMLDLSRKKNAYEPIPYASTLRSGVVKMAIDGEYKEGVVVQGSDRRLRDATTEFKGIVELATDGEERVGVVVQGNDKRLKNATENTYGLIKLAKNAESRNGVVVQGDDERLRFATTEFKGIVELAEDGETRNGVVVQGNDSRLKKATTKDYGLVILSDLGDIKPGEVVTGDDPRLRTATIESTGILRFANNGEDSSLAAVQGNDKRLKHATTESFGIVQLAQSGEDKEGIVVQGNDKRLKYATEEDSGIVTFASHTSTMGNKAVQSNDPRLYDNREPKEHSHNYAPLEHDFNSHSGFIKIKGTAVSEYKNIVSPPQNRAVIYGKNESKGGSGVYGVGIDEGVLGFGEDIGIIGLSNGTDNDSSGVAGFSKKGYGGEFVSQKNYAIYANGKGISKREITGSGKAIYATGDSEFVGSLRVYDVNGNDCIARYFKLYQNEIISDGELMVITEKESRVLRSKNAYSTKVVGVSVKESAIELGEKKNSNEYILVAMYGVVMVSVDATDGAILPGDLLVSGITSGHAIKADLNKLKPGMLIGKSLGECKKDRALIPVLLTIQ